MTNFKIIHGEGHFLVQLHVSAWTPAWRAIWYVIGSIFLKSPTLLKTVFGVILGDLAQSSPPSTVHPKAGKCSPVSTNCHYYELTDLRFG